MTFRLSPTALPCRFIANDGHHPSHGGDLYTDIHDRSKGSYEDNHNIHSHNHSHSRNHQLLRSLTVSDQLEAQPQEKPISYS